MRTAAHLAVALVGLLLILAWTLLCAHRLARSVMGTWNRSRTPNSLLVAWTSTPYRNRFTYQHLGWRPRGEPGILGQRFSPDNIQINTLYFSEPEAFITLLRGTPSWLAAITVALATWALGMIILVGLLFGATQAIDHRASFLRTCRDSTGFTWQAPRSTPCQP